MNRLRVWLIPGIIVLLALGAIFYFRGQLPGKKPPVPKDGVMEVEIETKKPKGFAKPVEPSPQKKAESDSEAMLAALDSGNLADCAKITWDEELRKQCEDSLNYAAISKRGDESACDTLYDKELRIKCYDKIYMSSAVDQNDAELCKKISDPELRQMCLDQVTMLLAHSAKSADDCAGISSETLRKQCEDNYYLKSSARELSTEGCNNISDPKLAEQCKQTVAKNVSVMEQSKQAAQSMTVVKSSQEILELCDGLNETKEILCKNAVYPQLAFDKKDLSYCDMISNEPEADKCKEEQGERINTYFLRQAIATQNKALCNEITDEELKKICQNS